jgi:hypothetical protein
MADWQVTFFVVPRRAFAGSSISPASLRDTNWWTDIALPADYQNRLGTVATSASSSSADLQTWGPEDGNRIDVLSNKGHVNKITVRVDVRRLDSRFGAALLQFVRTIDALLVRTDGLVIEPQIGAFAAAIRSSSAWKFGNDPAQFLTTHAEELSDDE